MEKRCSTCNYRTSASFRPICAECVQQTNWMPKDKSCLTCRYFPEVPIKRCKLCMTIDQWAPKVVDKLDTALAAPLKECKGVTRKGGVDDAEAFCMLCNIPLVSAIMCFPLQEDRV